MEESQTTPEIKAAPSGKKDRQFRCPSCSGTLAFNPVQGKLLCPYCGREEIIPQSADEIVENSFEDYLKAAPDSLAKITPDALEVSCDQCGSVVTFVPPDAAGSCPFCAATIVALPKAADPAIAPKGVLPFQLSADKAKDGIQSWIKKRWFAPSALKHLARVEGIAGTYIPFWTYDANTQTFYTGERGTHYYVTENYTETDSDGRTVTRSREVERTRWSNVSGQVSEWFDDILVPATKSLSAKHLEALEPWDLDQIAPFTEEYLAGFKAQRGQVELRDGFDRAKAIMDDKIHTLIVRDIGGDEQRVSNKQTSFSGITFKHILLPVYVGAYNFRNKVFQVVMNARTGEVHGSRPYSWAKISMTIMSVILAIAFVALLGKHHH